MKFFLLILFLALSFPTSTLAQEITFLQDAYKQGETLQAEILIPNLVSEIISKNIIIKDSSNKEIKLGFFLKKISNEFYFIYFDLPLYITDGDYTLELKDLLYKEAGILKEISTSKKFKVNSSIQRHLLTIEPAIFKFEPKTPYLKLRVKNKESKTLSLSISSTSELIHTSKTELLIPPNSQESIKVYVDLEKIERGTKEFLNIAHYQIPIWILDEFPILTTKEKILSFSIIENEKEVILEELNAELNQNQVVYENIFIKNLLNKSLYNLQVSLTGNLGDIVDLNLTFIPEIEPYGKIEEYILINKKKSPKFDLYKGTLLIKNENYSLEFPIILNIIKEKLDEKETKEPKRIQLTKKTLEEKPKEETDGKFPFYFIMTITGIIILLVIIYLAIPKK